MHSSWITTIVVATSFLLFATGCTQSDWGTLDGVVQLNGAAVGPGTIMLKPIDGDRAGAMAMFGADGVYSVMSAGRKAGAPAGEYQVTIHGEDALGEGANPQAKSSIPSRYADAGISGLTVRIEPGENTQDFQLEP